MNRFVNLAFAIGVMAVVGCSSESDPGASAGAASGDLVTVQVPNMT